VALPSSHILYDRNRTAQLSHIPFILHQTAAKDTIPDQWVRSQKSCKQAYADFEYKVYLSI
jgi:mannosyltransferase OCH1-like enzyme